MSPFELHEMCHEACQECPQFDYYDDDMEFPGFGEFGNIPKRGMMNVVKFWREYGTLLWVSGYENALPPEAQELFEDIDKVINQALKDYFKRI